MHRTTRGGIVTKLLLWIVGIGVVAVAAIFGINAIDEELTPAAKAAVAIPPPPEPNERNGYIDFLGLGAPEGESAYAAGLKVLAAMRARDAPGFKSTPEYAAALSSLENVNLIHDDLDCRPETTSCLARVAAKPDLVPLIAKHEFLLKRYRAMREKTEFIVLFVPAGLEAPSGGFENLSGFQRVTFLAAAAMVNAGDLDGAVLELERENAYHRRIAAGPNMLLLKWYALRLLQSEAMFVSTLVREKAETIGSVLPRLAVLMRPLSGLEVDLAKAQVRDRNHLAAMLRKRESARLSDVIYRAIDRDVPWWNFAAPLLYRPQESINLFVAQTDLLMKVSEVPAVAFETAAADALRRARDLEPRGALRLFVNPAGRNIPTFDVFPGQMSLGFDVTSFAPRAHAMQGVNELVTLQIKLHAAGITSPEAVAAALAGPLGVAHPDPFTGKPMRYDAKTNSIGFEATLEYGSSALREVIKKFGRVAVVLGNSS
jgi:hypothetical protein